MQVQVQLRERTKSANQVFSGNISVALMVGGSGDGVDVGAIAVVVVVVVREY